ncbi:cytochrome P450 3A6-like [Oppia nitens]|uniref:cytochrome P450 3A6-like n=1 Tax=Oppia nitens TaxID=1686743 RepID=UPI0023D9C4DE|nr:cytochrome P450 3A6-like [Oppia nitens]
MMTSDPKLIKNILIKNFHIFCNSSLTLLTPVDHPIYRHVIDNSGDQCWQRMISIIRTLFSVKNLKSLADNKLGKNLCNLIKSMDEMVGHKSAPDTGIVVDIRQLFVNQSIDLLGSVMFSWKQQQQHNTYNDYPNSDKLSKIINSLVFPSKWRILCLLVLPKFILQVLDMSNLLPNKTLDMFAELMIDEFDKRLILSANNNTNNICDDFYQQLLNRCPDFNKSLTIVNNKVSAIDDNIDDEVNNKKSIDEIYSQTMDQILSKEEVMGNMLSLSQGIYVGHSVTMTYIIYELAINTDCQQKCYDELIATNCWDSRINGQLLFDWETVDKLDYLNACISETLRLHPAVNRDGRVANQDYIEETTGVTIKKGQEIQYSLSALQQCPDYYRMPDQFIPDRFLKHNKHLLIDSAYLPFGLGRRMCPGYKFALMAIKLTMAHLLIRYKFVAIDGQTVLKTDPIVDNYIQCPEKLFVKIEKRV